MTLIPTTPPPLSDLASDIHAAWADTKTKQVDAWEGYFKTGSLLAQARGQFPSNQDFGQWFDAQGFAFKQAWAWRLMQVARREVEARSFITAVLDAPVPGVNAVVAQLRAANPPVPSTPSKKKKKGVSSQPAQPRITDFLNYLRTTDALGRAAELRKVDERLHEFFKDRLISCPHTTHP